MRTNAETSAALRPAASPGTAPPAESSSPADPAPTQPDVEEARRARVPQPSGELGGRGGPEPTRFGDWESRGRCTDF